MKTSIFLFIITITTTLYAQFNEVIFQKNLYPTVGWNYYYSSQPLGDQNGDGYDDFWLTDCNQKKEYIFFGGPSPDTIAAFSFLTPNTNRGPNDYYSPSAAVDVNADGKKDLVIITSYSGSTTAFIYLGGKNLDTIPDIIFTPSYEGWRYDCSPFPLGDFDGDGKEDIVIRSPNYPSTSQQMGILMFHKGATVFDTIPYKVITGDPVLKKQIWYNSYGDINGDGKSDFAVQSYCQADSLYRVEIYLGNSNFDLTPTYTFSARGQFTWIGLKGGFRIIEDINRDGNDDMFIVQENEFFPNCTAAILYGGAAFDSIPDFGINRGHESIQQILSTGDVNGDGANDLMIKDYAFLMGDIIRLWLGGRNMKQTATKVWYRNDEHGLLGKVGDINGDGTDDLVVATGHQGCYYGMVTVLKGDTTVIGDTSTSIKENEREEDNDGFDVYPNPAKDEVNLLYGAPIECRIEIRILTSLGEEMVRVKKDGLSKGFINEKIKTENLSVGVYIVELIITEEETWKETRRTKKITIIR